MTGEKDNFWAVGQACDEDDELLRGNLTEWEIGTGGEYVVIYGVCESIEGNPPDAAFIAHAREDVPALVAEVERLRAENAVLRRFIPAPSIPVVLKALEGGGDG